MSAGNLANGILIAVLLGVAGTAAAEHAQHQHHENHQHDRFTNDPIGVMGAHAHATGRWMFSLRTMRMDMEGNRDGTDRLGGAEVLARAIPSCQSA